MVAITIAAGMTIDGATLNLGANNNIQMNSANSINSTIAQTTVNGSAGSYIWSQPLQGSSWKKVIIYFNGYTNVGTSAITFTVSFSFTPQIIANGTTLSIATISASGMTVPIGTSISGFIILEGY